MNWLDYIEANYEYKYVSGGKEIQLSECPKCFKIKHNAGIYINAKIGKGFCHHCSSPFDFIDLIAYREGVDRKKAYMIYKGLDDGFIKADKDDLSIDAAIQFPEVVEIEDMPMAFEYLLGRGVELTTAKYFNIKACKKNFKYSDGLTCYSKGKLIFYIYDQNGNIVSWQGRDVTGKSKYRYLFPKGFKQSQYLYNIQNIKDDADYILITEGVFDCIAWWQAGFKSVVATFGKKMSDCQLDILLSKGIKNFFIAWDNDAMIEIGKFADKIKHLANPHIVELPENKDADELTKKDLQELFFKSKKYQWENSILKMLNSSLC